MTGRSTLDADAALARRALEAGRAAGLAAVGVTSADVFEGTRHDLEERKAAGLHATMAFTYRNPVRASDPRATFPWARSLVAGAWAYNGRPSTPGPRARTPEPQDRPAGRVARYAARDHYADLSKALEAVADVLRDAGRRAAVVVDQNHLVDRAVAHRAGLGWYGKNSLILLPGAGSWFLLGSVVTDAALAGAEPPHPVADGCGSCTQCVAACPTGAIVAPGVVDARRCLAWVVQAPGSLPRDLRVAMGDRIYGCDDCQEACPPNRLRIRRAGRTPGHDAADSAHHVDDTTGEQVDLLDLLAADDVALLDRYGRWYIADRDPRWLRRNALIAVGNAASPDDERVVDALRRVIDGDDDMLAAHAVWAARRLGHEELVAHAAESGGPLVTDELAGPPPPARARVREATPR